jgi:hypothetical protein
MLFEEYIVQFKYYFDRSARHAYITQAFKRRNFTNFVIHDHMDTSSKKSKILCHPSDFDLVEVID